MFYCIKKKHLLIALAIVIILVILVAVAIGCMTSATRATFGKASKKLPVYGVEREDKVVALTFDAAWGADKTRKILDIMRENDAVGTFFLVGFWIDKFESEVKLIGDSAFEIGNHSRNHLKMSTLSQEDITKELSYVNDKVKRITGKECKVFRPPFGDYNDRLIESTASLGMTAIQWSVDSLDWKGLSADKINERVLGKVKNGSIILCHNNSDHIVDALPSMLKELKARGYKFVTVSELLYKDNFTIDNNGIQRQNMANNH